MSCILALFDIATENNQGLWLRLFNAVRLVDYMFDLTHPTPTSGPTAEMFIADPGPKVTVGSKVILFTHRESGMVRYVLHVK